MKESGSGVPDPYERSRKCLSIREDITFHLEAPHGFDLIAERWKDRGVEAGHARPILRNRWIVSQTRERAVFGLS